MMQTFSLRWLFDHFPRAATDGFGLARASMSKPVGLALILRRRK